jgi:hypothetical protein
MIATSITSKRLGIRDVQSKMVAIVERLGLGSASTSASRDSVMADASPEVRETIDRVEKQLLWAEEELEKLDVLEKSWNTTQRRLRSEGRVDLFASNFTSPFEEAQSDTPFEGVCPRCCGDDHRSARHRYCMYYKRGAVEIEKKRKHDSNEGGDEDCADDTGTSSETVNEAGEVESETSETRETSEKSETSATAMDF